MYYSYDTDENYNDSYSCMPFCPMINDEIMDYDMTRQYQPPFWPPFSCGPLQHWVPGKWTLVKQWMSGYWIWVRRWVPGHCEIRPGPAHNIGIYRHYK